MFFEMTKNTPEPAIQKRSIHLDKIIMCGICMKTMKKVNETRYQCPQCNYVFDSK